MKNISLNSILNKLQTTSKDTRDKTTFKKYYNIYDCTVKEFFDMFLNDDKRLYNIDLYLEQRWARKRTIECVLGTFKRTLVFDEITKLYNDEDVLKMKKTCQNIKLHFEKYLLSKEENKDDVKKEMYDLICNINILLIDLNKKFEMYIRQ